MKKMLLFLAGLLLLAAPVMAEEPPDELAIKPIVGASFGSIQHGTYDNSNRISYWGGIQAKQLTKTIAVWTVYQHTQIEKTNLSAGGGKIILTVANKQYPDWLLLLGGGFLDNFAFEGEGEEKVDAFTFDLGAIHMWTDQVGIGILGSGVDTGPQMDWSIDLGVVTRF